MCQHLDEIYFFKLMVGVFLQNFVLTIQRKKGKKLRLLIMCLNDCLPYDSQALVSSPATSNISFLPKYLPVESNLVSLKEVTRGNLSTIHVILLSHMEASYRTTVNFQLPCSVKYFVLFCMNLYHSRIYIIMWQIHSNGNLLFVPNWSVMGTIYHLPCMTVKMAATVIALHSGQKETQFPLLSSLVSSNHVKQNFHLPSKAKLSFTKYVWTQVVHLYAQVC